MLPFQVTQSSWFIVVKPASEIQVLSMLAIKWQGHSRIFQFVGIVGRKTAKDSAETFAYYVGNCFSIPWQFAMGYDLFFWQLKLLVLPKLYCFLIKHLNRWNRRQYFSCWSPYFGFCMSPCYTRRTHPTLEKPGAQIIAACED